MVITLNTALLAESQLTMRRSSSKIGFTKVDHVTFDVILPLLSTAAQSVFLRIYRQTLGWSKEVDTIPNSHFKKNCHIKHNQTIQDAIDELKELDLITVEGKATQIKTFGIKLETLWDYHERYEAGEFD